MALTLSTGGGMIILSAKDGQESYAAQVQITGVPTFSVDVSYS
jgi:hypothetical protein